MNTKSRILNRWSKAGHKISIQNYGIDKAPNSSSRYDVREVDRIFQFKKVSARLMDQFADTYQKLAIV